MTFLRLKVQQGVAGDRSYGINATPQTVVTVKLLVDWLRTGIPESDTLRVPIENDLRRTCVPLGVELQ